MNPKDQIHYDIAELLEKIAHLNIKLAGTAKIHPVELDLLRSYLTELEKLANAMPVMPLAKPSFSIPTPSKEEATTLPSFNTPNETVTQTAVLFGKDLAEPVMEEPVVDTYSEPQVSEETQAKEPEVVAEKGETAVETTAGMEEQIEVEQTEESEPSVPEEHEMAEAPATDNSIETFAFEDLAAPITETPEPTEAIAEEPVAEAAPNEPETRDLAPDEPVAASEPEPLPEEPAQEPQANTGPELPIVETPLSYEPPVKEPEQKRSINDMFSREGKEDLGSRFQFQNRKNLREMIDLSERYVFTKELFGGDADYYDRAIRQLNQFESLADAQAYMDNELHNKYNWAKKEQVKGQFARIVERRFA